MTPRDLASLGLDGVDVLLVSGDAYVDHPSFGTAVIGRVLWDAGYTVGVVAQPGPDPADLLALGPPRLFVSVSSGAVDSMVNRYTPNRRYRSRDVYAPGGIPRRPDRAVLVYTDRVHALFPGTPVVLGGIEASLRRFVHYDYWSDSIRGSVLADAPADILVYGPGERQVIAIADRLDGGEDVRRIRDVRGTMWKCAPREWRGMDRVGFAELPGFPAVADDPRAFARA